MSEYLEIAEYGPHVSLAYWRKLAFKLNAIAQLRDWRRVCGACNLHGRVAVVEQKLV
jgi:hypothetical protein